MVHPRFGKDNWGYQATVLLKSKFKKKHVNNPFHAITTPELLYMQFITSYTCFGHLFDHHQKPCKLCAHVP